MAERKSYAGKILRVNLSTGEIKQVPTVDYADRFLGGRGIAAKVHWDEVSPEIDGRDLWRLTQIMAASITKPTPRWIHLPAFLAGKL
jgi:hypothetical protein